MYRINVFIIILGFICLKGYSQEYYRVNNEKYFNGPAKLIINNNMFEITIFSEYYDKHIGKIDGKMEKLITPSKPSCNYYYSIINNYSGEYIDRKMSCIVLFMEDNYGVRIIIHGDINPNLWEGSYEGLYIKNTDIELNKEENKLLEKIFSEYFDIDFIKELLNYNLKYFLETFQSFKTIINEDIILIEGWIPGGNQFTNGIVLIDNNKIYILFGDIRKWWDWEYQYYTNIEIIDDFNNNYILDYIPKEIKEWRFFPKDIRRINVVK